jgi:hypothetical protein
MLQNETRVVAQGEALLYLTSAFPTVLISKPLVRTGKFMARFMGIIQERKLT